MIFLLLDIANPTAVSSRHTRALVKCSTWRARLFVDVFIYFRCQGNVVSGRGKHDSCLGHVRDKRDAEGAISGRLSPGGEETTDITVNCAHPHISARGKRVAFSREMQQCHNVPL